MEHILKLKPVLKDYIWGGHKLETLYGRNNGGQPVSESWEVSVHPDGLTTYEEVRLPIMSQLIRMHLIKKVPLFLY